MSPDVAKVPHPKAGSEPHDRVTLEIIRGKLLSAADEMGVVLARTSMSPVIYEVLDFACGIVDAKAQVISQTNGITVFTGTFAGHVGADRDIDGDDWMTQDGAFTVPDGYDEYLHQLVNVHANTGRLASRIQAAPVGVWKGDIREVLPGLLDKELKSLVVAAAFFDLDIYEPTVAALETILPRCHAGTLLVFDELNSNRMPGETQAVLDTVGLGGLRLERSLWDSMSWATLG